MFMVCLYFPAHSPGREWLLADDHKQPAVLGEGTSYVIRDNNETLVELAWRYDLGYNEITLANPDLDPWYPGARASVLLPTSWIIPKAGSSGRTYPLIIINLGELRLYFFNQRKSNLFVTTFPVGIGRQGFETATGRYWVTKRKKDPCWTIPSSLRDEYPGGTVRVPPGSANPLGRYALRLSRHDYFIHGTNKPLGIGRRVSHGCIRMYPEDIEKLYEMTPVGCEVLIVYETVKVGVKGGIPFIEVHPDYLNNKNQQTIARYLLFQNRLWGKIDSFLLHKAVEGKKGIPVALQ
ncbi:MAG: L,D-transpeptidase [Thermodesulfobacteriota bacterium]